MDQLAIKQIAKNNLFALLPTNKIACKIKVNSVITHMTLQVATSIILKQILALQETNLHVLSLQF
jgi:hypothetical protein